MLYLILTFDIFSREFLFVPYSVGLCANITANSVMMDTSQEKVLFDTSQE